MKIVKEMAIKGHHQLLLHPLTPTFLALKWMTIRRRFDTVFIIYALLAIFHTLHCYMITHLKERNWDQCRRMHEANASGCQHLERDPEIIFNEANSSERKYLLLMQL